MRGKHYTPLVASRTWDGTHTSGPIRLEMSWDGSSMKTFNPGCEDVSEHVPAIRKERRNSVFLSCSRWSSVEVF